MNNTVTQDDTGDRGNTNIPIPDVRARNWCLTINNYSKEEVNDLKNLKKCKVYFQEEIGTENGTPHLQITLSFENARTFSSVKKTFPRARIQKCKDLKASIKYCTKEETRNGETYISHPDELMSTDERIYKHEQAKAGYMADFPTWDEWSEVAEMERERMEEYIKTKQWTAWGDKITKLCKRSEPHSPEKK